VSEPLYLPEPYQPGVHYVEAPVEQLAETIRQYLADDDARRRITEEAYRFVTTELTLERSFSRLLELAREATLRAA
jgi:glycosyltransferase involved in cell wall biosynthesis